MIPIQLLTLGHTVRVCYDLTNYAELSINSNGDLTIHKLIGGSPKIIDKTVTDETFTIPPTDRPLKVGDILVSNGDDWRFDKKGEEFPIIELLSKCETESDGLDITIKTDFGTKTYYLSSFDENSQYYYKNFFTLKP